MPIVFHNEPFGQVGLVNTTTASMNAQLFAQEALATERYYKLAVLHAIVGGLATMVVFPLGLLGVRALRLMTKRWWWAHALFHGVFGGGLVTFAFVLSMMLVGNRKDFTLGHRQTGLILLVLVWLQIVIGVALKATANIHMPVFSGHRVRGIVHGVIGVGIIGLGFYQTWTGLDLFIEMTHRSVPKWVYVIWGGLAGVAIFGYAFSFVYVPQQLRKEAADKEDEEKLVGGAAEEEKEAEEASESTEDGEKTVAEEHGH